MSITRFRWNVEQSLAPTLRQRNCPGRLQQTANYNLAFGRESLHQIGTATRALAGRPLKSGPIMRKGSVHHCVGKLDYPMKTGALLPTSASITRTAMSGSCADRKQRKKKSQSPLVRIFPFIANAIANVKRAPEKTTNPSVDQCPANAGRTPPVFRQSESKLKFSLPTFGLADVGDSYEWLLPNPLFQQCAHRRMFATKT